MVCYVEIRRWHHCFGNSTSIQTKRASASCRLYQHLVSGKPHEANPSKSKELQSCFKSSPPTHAPVELDGFVFERVNSAKVLGVTISDDLKWNDHILNVTSKAAKRLYLLRQLKRAGICASDVVLFYCSTIGSVLENACQVFQLSLPFYLSEELERIQQCALRTIFPYASYNSALKEAGIPLFTTGERHYRLIFLMTLFLTLITRSQVCSHQKLITIGSCAAIESSTCQCAKRSALKNLLLLAIV